MNIVALTEINLIGLTLKGKTINSNGQSTIDCKNLWEEFTKENYAEKISNKLSNEVFGVYHQYEGDSSKPFSYFVGCRVEANTEVPPGLQSMTIPAGKYQKINAKGTMPDCVINAWQQIWTSDIPRAYQIDFEIYDERSTDWNNAEVDVYLSLKSN